MRRQRKRHLPAIAMILAGWASCAAQAAAPDILLPEPFAVELPLGMDSLGIDDEPLRQLTASVEAGGHGVTAILPRKRIGAGAWRIILAAWEGDQRDRPVAQREAVLVVLPHGMIPAGRTGHASQVHIARDASGFLHMVWTDAWRPGAIEGAMYRRAQILPDGTLRFDTDIQPLGPHRGVWTAMPTLCASGDTVYFAWQADGTTRYRSLSRAGAGWRWSEEVDTKAPALHQYAGPSIAADGRAVHILTADGRYLTSSDGGSTWMTETAPFGAYQRLDGLSLTLDKAGRPLAVASVVIDDPPRSPGVLAQESYPALRIVRLSAPGVWQSLQDPIDGAIVRAEPRGTDSDVIPAGALVAEDDMGAMHALWQGTASGRADGLSLAYYGWQPPGGSWTPPLAVQEPEPVRAMTRSFVAGLILDGTRALTLVAREVREGWRYRGLDSELNLFRDGQPHGSALPVTRFLANAIRAGERAEVLSVASQAAASGLYRTSNGRIWADLLMVLQPGGPAVPGVVVVRRLDVTDWLEAAR